MSNANAPLVTDSLGGPPFTYELPVDGGSKVYKGTLVTQLTATGQVVPYSTASAGVCVGVAQASVDNSAGSDSDKWVRVETMRGYAFTNGTAGDAFADATLIGSIVYGTDDHTVAKTSSSQTRKAVGFFLGMDADGLVRVFVDPTRAKLADALASLTTLTDSPATADALRDNIVSVIAAALG